MRISGWSSDVCSSDLKLVAERIGFGFFSVAHVEHELTKAQAGNRLERQRVILLDGRHVAGVSTFKDVYADGHKVRQTYRDRRISRLKLQSLMRNPYADYCFKKQTKQNSQVSTGRTNN